MLTALTRPLSRTIAECELTYLDRRPIDRAAAEAQHGAYTAALAALGCRLITLDPIHDLPDAVFVEDTAVVLDEVAVMTRPGAESRRPELPSVERALAPFRPIERITPPGTLDGGDVLRIDRVLIVGLSRRSNAAGIDQLRALLAPHGYEVRAAAMRGCLHFLSGCSYLGGGVVLFNPDWIDPATFADWETLQVDPAEPEAANALRLGDTLIHAAAFPRTAARLRDRGFTVQPVDNAELAKAEGGVTCCSIIFDAP